MTPEERKAMFDKRRRERSGGIQSMLDLMNASNSVGGGQKITEDDLRQRMAMRQMKNRTMPSSGMPTGPTSNFTDQRAAMEQAKMMGQTFPASGPARADLPQGMPGEDVRGLSAPGRIYAPSGPARADLPMARNFVDQRGQPSVAMMSPEEIARRKQMLAASMYGGR